MEELLLQFFYYPMKPFGVRELARELHLSSKTIMKYLSRFVKDKIVVRIKERNKFVHYEANRLSKKYKLLKSCAFMKRVAESGLVEFLEKELNPKAIVIFGSVQKGTYLKHSDVDIFIQERERNINVSFFEKKIGHDIQLLFAEDLNELTEGLKNNVINGNTISGGLEL
jgi:predicted nucleotidyltransferase